MDPRLSLLGQRAVLAGPPQSPESAPAIYSRQFRHWRIEHGVAEGPEEMPAGALLVFGQWLCRNLHVFRLITSK